LVRRYTLLRTGKIGSWRAGHHPDCVSSDFTLAWLRC
jgi:hypothetical protein